MIGTLTEFALALSASAALSALIKTSIAGLCGLAAARLAHRGRAAVRHGILAATFAVMVAVPFVAATAPAVPIRIPVAAAPALVTARVNATPPVARPLDDATSLPEGRMPISFSTFAAAAWTTGAVLFLFWFGAAVWQLRRIRRTGLPWLEATGVVNTLAAHARITERVDVLLHEDVVAPLVCGLRRPAIILPTDVQEWSEPALRRALVHELEHVRRRDWWVHLAARVVCAAYWFNPIVWIAYRQLSLEAERACDDAVMEREEATQYAEQLVALARRMAGRRTQPALAMASRSDLSRRISAVLDGRQVRGRAGIARASLVGVLAATFVIILAPMRVAGTVTPPVTLDADGQAQRGRARVSADGRARVEADGVTQRTRTGVSRAGRALVEAAEEGNVEELKWLLDAGADINAAVDGDGSPLIVAARSGRMGVVTFLLDRGADVNMPVEGDGNPLIMAAGEGHLPIVQLLLDRGANVNQIVPSDENALITASGAGHLDVVKLLVARGAEVNARAWAASAFERPAGEWRTALSMARRGRHADVVAFLLSAGAVE